MDFLPSSPSYYGYPSPEVKPISGRARTIVPINLFSKIMDVAADDPIEEAVSETTLPFQRPVQTMEERVNPAGPCLFHTPKKRYSLTRTSSGRIRLLTTPGFRKRLKKRTPIIYSWKRNAADGRLEKRLIGTTERADGRVSSYLWGFNHTENTYGVFSKEVAEHPEEFSFGVVLDLAPGAESGAAETREIEFFGKDHCYNLRRGGGGGKCLKLQPKECQFTIAEIVDMIKEDYVSPPPKILHRVRGRLQFDFSVLDKKVKGAIYEILFDSTGEKKDRVHHVGYTTTTVSRRFSSHHSSINCPEASKKKPLGGLYKQILANPKKVSARLFNIEELLAKGIPIPRLESAFMEFFHRREEKVRNYGSGGKGSVAKDYQPVLKLESSLK